MIYKNILFHNVAEIINNDDGSISWKRVPTSVHNEMEAKGANSVVYNSTGVELRFVLKGKSAILRMSKYEKNDVSSCFHIYRGAIQGGWTDHEIGKIIHDEPKDFLIERSSNIENLKVISQKCKYNWDPEVIRIIFDRGRYKIYNIIGDIEPPKYEQCPKKTILAYGSSITHGSNSIDMSHSWVSILAHNLNMDQRNLGMAGSCALEPKMAEYIANEGKNGKWDIACFEFGINVLGWNNEKIAKRVTNFVTQTAVKNPLKPIFVISPFCHCGEFLSEDKNAEKWRVITEKCIKEMNFSNVFYINGFDILDDMCYISADEVHPNIYGVQRIAEKMTQIINDCLSKGYR